LIVGLDLDGVLGDQIEGVLPRIKRRLGIELTYDQITEFRLPLGTTDLAEEILAAQTDESYLLGMRLHPGAEELVRELRVRDRAILITARPPASRQLTLHWLAANGFEFDGIINAREAKKSIYGADVLVDDYTANIEDFEAHTSGLGILVDRPWNRAARERLAGAMETGRVVVAADLFAVIPLIEQRRAQLLELATAAR
jgi:5'(3')-deoxyribonucleotidase